MRPESVCPVGGVLMLAADCHCHSPFRFCQLARTICGRGYSGSGLAMAAVAAAVQGVLMRGVLGATPRGAALTCDVTRPNNCTAIRTTTTAAINTLLLI